jgi:hypothetical protein
MSSVIANGAGYTAAEALEDARAATQIDPPPDDLPKEGIFADETVERTTFHDFALYEYAFDPWVPRDDRETDTEEPDAPAAAETPPPPAYLPADLADLAWMTDYTRLLITEFINGEVRAAMTDGAPFDPRPILQLLALFQTKCLGALRRHYWGGQLAVRADDMLVFFVERFLADVLGPFERMGDQQRQAFFDRYFDAAVRDWARRSAEMEMPWLVPHNRGQADWVAAGYVVGEAFGKVPEKLALDTRGTPHPPYKLNGWVKDGPNGTEVLSHEWAWDHIRIDNGNGASSIAPVTSFDRKHEKPETWFVVYADWGSPTEPAVSEVLAGAEAILAEGGGLDRVEKEIWAAFVKQYPRVLAAATAPTESAAERYGFQPFPEGSINFGIRVVYRQAWKPRGVQQGELVRSIPLGPGQTEKVSVKIQRRNKLTRELEDLNSTETTQETTSRTTTSSELVEEAASAHKWHVESSAQGSFNLGIVGVNASLSGGYAGESSKHSADTKKSLTEAMHKAARVSRRQNRVKVSTEHEESFEETRASEIVNPNQEIAVTYVYDTIQRVYRVETALEAIEPVLYVGEHVPGPGELGLAWVRRYDWLLSRVLLDESFREALQLVATAEPDFLQRMLTAQALGLDEVQHLRDVVEKAKASLAALATLPGDVANTYEAAVQAYQAAVERSRELLRAAQAQVARIDRLLDHLADNILHYCRAIWSAEDPERRSMRYAALRVPTQFTESMNTQNVETDPETGQTIYTGSWVPDPTSWMRLTKLISPAGPVGFAGNYAIYRLRRTRDTDGISRVIRIAQQAYYETLPPEVHVNPGGQAIPGIGGAARLQAEVVIKDEDFYGGDSYVLKAAIGPRGRLQYRLFRRNLDGVGPDITAAAALASGLVPGQPVSPMVLSFDGLELTVRGRLRVGDVIHMVARRPRLVDPEVKYRMALEPFRPRAEVEQALRDENTSDVVIDTTNLWLSLLPGDGSVLEPFKREHRRIDVEIARTELARRLMRLQEGRLGDPKIDKNVHVNGMAVQPALIAASEAADGEAAGDRASSRTAATPSADGDTRGVFRTVDADS